jgi:hypothetical protein
MEGGVDVSDGSSEQESIPDNLSLENSLQSDISDMSSETDDGEAQHDSYDSDGFSKEPLSNDIAGYRYEIKTGGINKKLKQFQKIGII